MLIGYDGSLTSRSADIFWYFVIEDGELSFSTKATRFPYTLSLMLNRYTVRPYTPIACKGRLPGNRLRRVLDYIGDNLAEDLSLAQSGCGCRDEFALFRRAVQKEHRLCSPPVCALRENRARKTGSSGRGAQYH